MEKTNVEIISHALYGCCQGDFSTELKPQLALLPPQIGNCFASLFGNIQKMSTNLLYGASQSLAVALA